MTKMLGSMTKVLGSVTKMSHGVVASERGDAAGDVVFAVELPLHLHALRDRHVCRHMHGGMYSHLRGPHGGGTAFWPEGPNGEREQEGGCEVVVGPPRGTAIVFNGNIRHAGKEVESGVRHLYVCSFDLIPVQTDGA